MLGRDVPDYAIEISYLTLEQNIARSHRIVATNQIENWMLVTNI